MHRSAPANLDAICVLLDEERRPLEVVSPGRLDNVNGSVVHTGDSPAGASTWDDERIFAFLDAVPQAVRSLVFGVVSSDGRPFCDVAGASCHVSDYRTEDKLLGVQLTALGLLTEYCVATLKRTRTGWIMQPGAPGVSLRQPLAMGPAS